MYWQELVRVLPLDIFLPLLYTDYRFNSSTARLDATRMYVRILGIECDVQQKFSSLLL
jgi:hypothetical protein